MHASGEDLPLRVKRPTAPRISYTCSDISQSQPLPAVLLISRSSLGGPSNTKQARSSNSKQQFLGAAATMVRLAGSEDGNESISEVFRHNNSPATGGAVRPDLGQTAAASKLGILSRTMMSARATPGSTLGSSAEAAVAAAAAGRRSLDSQQPVEGGVAKPRRIAGASLLGPELDQLSAPIVAARGRASGTLPKVQTASATPMLLQDTRLSRLLEGAQRRSLDSGVQRPLNKS